MLVVCPSLAMYYVLVCLPHEDFMTRMTWGPANWQLQSVSRHVCFPQGRHFTMRIVIWSDVCLWSNVLRLSMLSFVRNRLTQLLDILHLSWESVVLCTQIRIWKGGNLLCVIVPLGCWMNAAVTSVSGNSSLSLMVATVLFLMIQLIFFLGRRVFRPCGGSGSDHWFPAGWPSFTTLN